MPTPWPAPKPLAIKTGFLTAVGKAGRGAVPGVGMLINGLGKGGELINGEVFGINWNYFSFM